VKTIDLNVDIAEGFPFDDDLLQFASSGNVCCGAHSGSQELTFSTLEKWLSAGKQVGLHPGYPDRVSMGRSPITPELARTYLDSIFAQVRAVQRFSEVAYLKPHGAFYNDTAIILPPNWNRPGFGYVPGQDPASFFLSRFPGVNSLSMLLRIYRLRLLGLPGTAHPVIAERAGHGFAREGFADRRYAADGTLVPRSDPTGLLDDPAEITTQVVRLAPQVDSICLHGDRPDSLELAELVARALHDAGYGIAPWA
jgi:UPF0271 protein